MKIVNSLALASVLALGLTTAAQAQETSLAPSVPNPANPYPLNPVASDGTPLLRYNGVDGGVYSGRSAYAPGGIVGGIVGAGVGAADTGLGAGLGLADDVLR